VATAKPEVGKTTPLPEPVLAQEIAKSAATGLAAKQAELGFVNQQNAALVDAVIKDPTGVVYANLPGEKQKEIAPVLAQRGNDSFGCILAQLFGAVLWTGASGRKRRECGLLHERQCDGQLMKPPRS